MLQCQLEILAILFHSNDNTNTDQVNSSDYSTCGTVKFTDLEIRKGKIQFVQKCNINPAVTSHQTVDASDVNTLSNCEKVVIAPKRKILSVHQYFCCQH